MKTIKARDAKFGRFYEMRRNRMFCFRYNSTGDRFVGPSGTIYTINQHDLIELPPECDSFDWVPAKAGSDNPNGVRWMILKQNEGGGTVWAIDKDGNGYYFDYAACHTGGTLPSDKVPDHCKEILTPEALSLIGKNGWTEGVAEAKRLAGIVDEVELIEEPRGFYCKYKIEKANGDPVDDGAIYFVLRLDGGGSDPKHIQASRLAAQAYANSIADDPGASHLHKLADDLRDEVIAFNLQDRVIQKMDEGSSVVEHPITEGSVWKTPGGVEYKVVHEPHGWIARDTKDGSPWRPHSGDISRVFEGCENVVTWLRDADPTTEEPKAEEVRWYLAKKTGSIRGYIDGKAISVYAKHGDVFKNHLVIGETACIVDGDLRISTAEVLCRLASAGHNDAWHAARKLVGMDEPEAYLTGQSVCGIKPGDTVRVVRSSCSFEMGWEGIWDIRQDTESYQDVIEVGRFGIQVRSWRYPYFVLAKVEKRLGQVVAEGLKEFTEDIEKGGTPKTQPVGTISDKDSVEQSAPEIDPGEGWRLVDKNEPLLPGDQFYNGIGSWVETTLKVANAEQERKCRCLNLVYRRPAQPAHGFKVGDWVRFENNLARVLSECPKSIEAEYLGGGILRACTEDITKVRFRPFANAAEFKPFRDQWFPRKDGTAAMRFSYIRDSGADHNAWEYLFRTYQFENGQPFGIAEDVE